MSPDAFKADNAAVTAANRPTMIHSCTPTQPLRRRLLRHCGSISNAHGSSGTDVAAAPAKLKNIRLLGSWMNLLWLLLMPVRRSLLMRTATATQKSFVVFLAIIAT